MANPSRKYLEQLKRYGLGSGGLGFNPMGERTVFAEEGPSSTIDVDVFDKGVANLAKRFGISPEEVKKRQGLGTKIISGSSQTKTMPSDVSSFSELAKAYSDIKDVSKDPSVISQPATIEDILTADPSVFRLEGPEGMPVAPIDSSGAGDGAEAQKIIAEKESLETSKKNQKTTAEGKAIFDAKQQIRGAESDALNKLFEQSMEDYLTNVRGVGPERRTKDLAEYKREFAEATGIDISGKVDKSSALMSLGLAMMQNRAGKGFNVGRLFSEFGKAGEAAMPALEAAKKQARNDGIAAGKYALEAKSADQAIDAANAEKAMAKNDYFIVPNIEGGVSGDIAGILSNKGRLEKLSKYELNALMKDKDFTNKFTILPGSTHAKVVEEALSTKDGTALWDDKVVTRSLIEGIDDPLFQIDLSYGKSGGSKQGEYVLRDAEQIGIAENALLKMSKDNQKAREQFVELGILTGKNRNVFNYTADKVSSLASAFGVQFNPEETERDNIIRILDNLAMKNASTILGESGKTISDGDRERVERIVGQLRLGTDIRTLRPRIQSLFNDIIIGTEEKITQGLRNLSRYSGKDYGLNDQNPLNEDEIAELAADDAAFAGEKK